MDKRLILAVAGSGKTTYLIKKLNLKEKFLIVTYTNTSLNLIKTRIIKEFGYHPNNIRALSYFDFIYSYCIRPFCLFKYKIRGVSWKNPPDFTNYLPKEDIHRYLSSKGYLYYNRLGKFVDYDGIIDDIKSRLEKFYDHFFFDEFQDLGGHDFNFIMNLVISNINFLFVGDFFQNTYVTSYDGIVNNGLYSRLDEYCKKIKKHKIVIDMNTLGNSYRCSPTICKFICQNLGIDIHSMRNDETKIVNVSERQQALELLGNNNIIKLVYKDSNKRNYKAKNWGDCKGEDDYVDTCIILNKTTAELFTKNKLIELASRTKNKLYVAISRTRGNCYFIDERLIT